jgi:hypothetical protein
MEKMRVRLRRLNLISKIIDLNQFYTIGLYGNEITLQGVYKSNLALELTKKKFKYKISENGYVWFTRNGIRVILEN